MGLAPICYMSVQILLDLGVRIVPGVLTHLLELLDSLVVERIVRLGRQTTLQQLIRDSERQTDRNAVLEMLDVVRMTRDVAAMNLVVCLTLFPSSSNTGSP